MWTLSNVMNSKQIPYDWKIVPTHGLFHIVISKWNWVQGHTDDTGKFICLHFCPKFAQNPMSCTERHREEYIVHKIILLKINISTSAFVQVHPAQTQVRANSEKHIVNKCWTPLTNKLTDLKSNMQGSQSTSQKGVLYRTQCISPFAINTSSMNKRRQQDC